jgi:succinate dehydrogenase/fumarate reductase-like Fe-S protein
MTDPVRRFFADDLDLFEDERSCREAMCGKAIRVMVPEADHLAALQRVEAEQDRFVKMWRLVIEAVADKTLTDAKVLTILEILIASQRPLTLAETEYGKTLQTKADNLKSSHARAQVWREAAAISRTRAPPHTRASENADEYAAFETECLRCAERLEARAAQEGKR